MAVGLPELRDGLTAPTRRLLRLVEETTRALGRRRVKTNRVLLQAIASDPSVPLWDWYALLLRLGQPWLSRYPLLDTLGNFGNIDGDPPCGMQFNEVGLAAWGRLLASEPSAFPQLLVNGAWSHDGGFEHELDGKPPTSVELQARENVEGAEGDLDPVNVVPTGRLVGGTLRSFLLPHNLGEICAGLLRLVEAPGTGLSGVLESIKGPDFPTGGVLLAGAGLERLYRTGEGEVEVAARARVEEGNRGRTLVVVSEIPYGIDKARLFEGACVHVQEGRLPSVIDVRDLSNRDGIRIEVEVERGGDPERVLQELHRTEVLRNRVPVRMVVEDRGASRTVGLLELMRSCLEGRRAALRDRLAAAEAEEVLRRELRDLGGRSDPRRTLVGRA